MATLTPLYPNAGPTAIPGGAWSTDSGGTVTVGDASDAKINTAPTAPGVDTDFITVDSGSIEYPLGNMPGDFASLDSLTINIRFRTNGLINDTYTLSATIFDSGGTVIGSVTTLVTATTSAAFTTYSVAVATITDPANKSRWDGAVIRLTAIRNANMGADGGSTGQISAVQLTGTYTSSGPTEYTDSGTAYLKLTPSGDEAKSPQLVPPLVADFQEGLAKNGIIIPDTAGDPDFSIRWGSPTYVVNGGEVYAAFDPGENFEWRNIFFDPFSGEVIRTSVIVKHPWSDVEPGEGAGSHQEFLNFFALGEEYELLTGFVYSLDDNKWHVECISAGDFNKSFVTPVPGNQFIRVDVAFDPTFGSIQMQLYLDPNGPATETLDVPGNYPEFFLSPDWMTFGRTGGDEPGTITFDSINVRYTEYRADAATVYLTLTPSGVDEYIESSGPFEYLDSGTAYLDLTPSGVDLVERADSATTRIALTPSATENRDVADSATIYVDLTASATEAREIADASTARLTLTPSGVEQRELVDATTVSLKLTPSGTEFVERVTEDAATAYLDLTPSATEEYARILVDAGVAYLKLTPSGTEEHARLTSDAATAYVDLTPTSVELQEAVDAATARVTLTPSATEFYAPPKTTGVDEVEFEEPAQNPDTGLTTVYMRARANSGTGIIRLIAYQDSVELDREDFVLTLSIQEFSFEIAGITDYEPLTVSFEGLNLDGGELEAYIADIWMGVPAGVVTHYEDSNTVYVKLTPSADEVYTPPEGQEYIDSATARVTLTPSGTEAKEVTDAQTVRLTLTASATEGRELQDEATTRISLTPSATEAREITDAATVTLSLTASGSDVLVAADASTTTVRLTPSGTDELTAGGVFTDAATAYVDLTPSGIDLRERVDTAEVYVDLTPSAVEVRERADAATVYVDLTASATEAREITDAATVPLALTPSSLETYERVDAATAYLDLTPSGTDQLVTEGVDVGTAYVDLTPSSIDIIAALETGVAYLDISVGGTDEPVFVDSGTAYVDILPSGTEETTTEYFDAATAYVSLLPSAEDVLATVGVYAVPLTLTPSAVELIEFGDTGTVYLDLAPGAGYMFDNPLLTLNLSRRYTGVLASRHFAGALASRRFGASLTARQFSGSLRSRHVEAQLLARKYNASLTR